MAGRASELSAIYNNWEPGTNSLMSSRQACSQPGKTSEDLKMARRDDDTVYCDVQMPIAQARELLQLVTVLHESRAHPGLDSVF